jgi:hypothetical protein
MTDQEKITAEKNELNLIINKGVSIEVERTIYKQPNGLLKWLKKPVPEIETLKFKIQELTLSTLDRISAEQIDLKIDEKIMSSDSGIQEARRMTKEHSKRLAKILAIAVLGQDYVISVQKGSHVDYRYDDSRLKELTELFFHNVKPSRLLQYVVLINAMSNLGDFTNSIRLMSASRTMMPILIEQKD